VIYTELTRCDLYKKPVVFAFDLRQDSSDGEAVLLQAANRRYRLIESLAACLCGRRLAGKVMAWPVANRMPTVAIMPI
jgi:hypothetical protein